MLNLDQLTDELHRLLLKKHDAKDIKLLNVSLAMEDEHHWRFRLPDGTILQISIWQENPPGAMRIVQKIPGGPA